MLNNRIFLPEIQIFIRANLHADLHSLLLKKSPFQEVSMPEIVQQIKGWQVAAKKFPFMLHDGIFFPAGLSLEQSSSEATARYKASLAAGKTFADLTSGFGIDAFFLAGNFSEVSLVEQNTELLEIVRHNWEIFGRKAYFINQSAETFLKKVNHRFDWIFLDPARRNAFRKKVFLLEDLSPDILQLQGLMKEKADNIMVKLSPLIDISYLVHTLENIAEIHIIAVKNEVKDLLVIMQKDGVANTKIVSINLESNEPAFSFLFGEEKEAVAEYSEAQRFLYIPNNAVLKSGFFNGLAAQFSLRKLHPNTHLYTSDQKLDSFPGRILEVEKVHPKALIRGSKWNIISKNYPLKPDILRKKYHLQDGGSRYLVFTEDKSGKIILASR